MIVVKEADQIAVDHVVKEASAAVRLAPIAPRLKRVLSNPYVDSKKSQIPEGA